MSFLNPVATKWLIDIAYFATAFLFIMGLKRMASPVTARSGIVWAGGGMLIATLVTFLAPSLGTELSPHLSTNMVLVVVAIAIGGGIAWVSGQRVAMTDMPQMIALYNGMGGGAAAAIAAVELYKGEEHTLVAGTLAVLGGLIGGVSFSGSGIAFGKLQGLIKKSYRFGGQQFVNMLILAGALVVGGLIATGTNTSMEAVTLFFVLSLLLGLTMTLPIGGADMPVVISLYNALTGLAVAFEGFVTQNTAMIIAGTVVGSAGSLLTQLMAKAMNRSLGNVLFSGFGDTSSAATGPVTGSQKPIDASVPYDIIADLDEINAEFETADVALIIGANDVVNPVARNDKSSPIYGMPILNADKAKTCIVIKRGQGQGFSGIENALFYLDNTRLLYGDGQKAAAGLIAAIKAVD